MPGDASGAGNSTGSSADADARGATPAGAAPAQGAEELARWASSELGKPPAAAAAPAGATSDAFARAARPREAVSRTHTDELSFGGVQRSRRPMLVAMAAGGIIMAGTLIWALAGGSAPPKPPPTEATPAAQAPKAPLGGTGDSSVAQLAAKAPAAPPAPDPARPEAKPARKKAGALSADQQADLRALDNARGVGTHGPAAGSAIEAPAVERDGAGLTADDVRKKLDQSKGALQACIDEALRVQPNLRVGKIHLATVIAPSGAVTSTRIDKQTVDQSPLGGCLKRATRRIVFPSFQGDAFEVDIPIVVTAGE